MKELTILLFSLLSLNLFAQYEEVTNPDYAKIKRLNDRFDYYSISMLENKDSLQIETLDTIVINLITSTFEAGSTLFNSFETLAKHCDSVGANAYSVLNSSRSSNGSMTIEIQLCSIQKEDLPEIAKSINRSFRNRLIVFGPFFNKKKLKWLKVDEAKIEPRPFEYVESAVTSSSQLMGKFWGLKIESKVMSPFYWYKPKYMGTVRTKGDRNEITGNREASQQTDAYIHPMYQPLTKEKGVYLLSVINSL